MDEIFSGNLRDKFYEIVFNASKNVVSAELDQILRKFCAMESMLNSHNLSQNLENFINQNGELIAQEMNDIYIQLSAKILSQSE